MRCGANGRLSPISQPAAPFRPAIAALEAQLREAGLDPVIEREQDRRISQGIDLYLGPLRKIVTMEEWEKTLDEL